jgi:hypothetical protein
MTELGHKVYISTLVTVVLIAFFGLSYTGFDYYTTPLEERFYHPNHDYFKPSGLLGHGIGILGTLLILIGVFGYIARKRYRILSRLGRLKYWLEFHIFLCTLGPILVLFHTAFKFGGIVSISFWSMVAVVISGVIGRFIYIQIPRTIEGRELTLGEVKEMKVKVEDLLLESPGLSKDDVQFIVTTADNRNLAIPKSLIPRMTAKFLQDRKTIKSIRKKLKQKKVTRFQQQNVIGLIKNEISLNNKIDRLHTMQKLFRYWHVAHLPFAIIMLIIMVIHVAITLAFGYKWIF